jgi:thiol-disulfide isomerase/thioredoxin
MKVLTKEHVAFFGFWAACVFFIFFGMGCSSPDLHTEDSSNNNGGNINIPTFTPPVKVDDTAQTVVPLGFLETDCGHNIGESACDFNLLDQKDNPWRLSEHVGDVVLLDLSAMWCAPCQSAAATAQRTQDDYASKGFHYVTILIVDAQNDTMDVSEAQHWADSFGITTAPVLQGSRDLLVSGGAQHGYPLSSWPTFVFLDRTHTVAYGIYGFNEEWIRNEIESLL